MDQPGPSSAAARNELIAIMQQVAGKDAAALRALYQRTSAKLYGICLRLLGDDGEAQDVLQEVYVTVWNKASSFDTSRASPIAWLAALARNRAIDRLRSRAVRGAGLVDDLEMAADLADGRPSSLDILEQAEDSSRLHHCLEELEAKARAMIRSAFFDGATYAQLAQAAGLPLPTVKSRIRRGLMRLRGCLEQ